MKASYHLPQPDFTPAPGWEHRIMATPEIALGHARQIYDLTTEEYELAIRSRHPLRTHRETMESNALITEILQLQSHLLTFINSGRWKPDWARMNRKAPARSRQGPNTYPPGHHTHRAPTLAVQHVRQRLG